MPSRTRARLNGEIRREQILEQALRLIGQQGYHGFTIHALAQACELSNAGLLHHFGSKDALLVAVLDEIGRREAAAVATVEARFKDGGRNQLVHVLAAIAQSAVTNPEVARFRVQLLAESIAPEHPAHDWFRLRQLETRTMLVEYTTGWTHDPQAIALQLHAVLNGFMLEWLHATRGFDLPAQLSAAVETIVGAHALD